jgi:hypothetical protein
LEAAAGGRTGLDSPPGVRVWGSVRGLVPSLSIAMVLRPVNSEDAERTVMAIVPCSPAPTPVAAGS